MKPSDALTKNQLLEMYYFARLARDVEERLVILFRQSKVIGGLYRSLGQEGESVATAYALERRDAVLPLIRNMGALMTVGVRPLEIFRQYMAKGTSNSRGRDLNIHIVHLPGEDADAPVIVGPISMLGDSIPVAAGIAMGAGMRGKPRVAMAWIGDGATSTGAFHEGLNFAAVQKIPLVVVAEDNKYAYSTPIAKQMAIARIDERAASYGIPHELVDGNDMLAVYDVAKRMVDRARAGGGAQLIGVDTMRMQGHAQHDDARYVPKATLDEWAAKDPLERFRKVLLQDRQAGSEEDLENIDRMTKDFASKEADLAVEEPMPDPATVARGVYAGDDYAVPRVELVKSPFAGRTSMAVITYLEAIRQALFDEMGRDERVFVIGEDVGAYGGAFKVTEGLMDTFGETRVIDTPISEAAIVGAAIGASYMGMRPVCEIQFIDFIACCFDMLTNFAATSRYRNGAGVPIVVRGPAGGGVGGGPFHSLNPEAFFLNTPGLKMVEPATAYDAKGLLKAAIRDDDPVLYFEHKFLYRRIKDEVPDEDYVVPLGKAAIRREGSDLSIITFGAMVHTAMDAAKQLEADGVKAEVLDLRSLAPLDRDAILTSVAKTSRALLLYEATRTGGIGGELAAIIAEEAFEYLDAPIMRIASVDAPVPYAPPLEAAFLPSVEKVVAGAKKLVEY